MPGGHWPSGNIQTETMANTLKIRILESVAGTDFNYGKGFEGEVPEHIARDLLKAGHAETLGGSSPHQRAEKAQSPAAKSEKR